jgi:UDP-glucose 4-epimerase
MKDGQRVILVTGANGFIGGHLVPVLESRGWIVRRAVRKLTACDNEVLIDSIGPTTNWRELLVGVDAVVHLAARVHHPNEEDAGELYRYVNVEGTLHLARSAARVGVSEFIFVSSILVNGRSTEGRGPISERDVLTPRGVYGTSKASAEVALREMAQDAGMRITVVRPPLVYGAGAKGNFGLLLQAVRRGFPLPFGSIRNRRAFLSVENLNSFILERLAHAQREFDVFLVADAEQVSTPEFIRRLARASGASSRVFPVPVRALEAMLKLSGNHDAYDSLIGSLELDVSKVAATGWRPPVSLDEGLRLATNATVIDNKVRML